MPQCLKCDTCFPNRVKIHGKTRHLGNRKFCLDCSPFGVHNTINLLHPRRSKQSRVEVSCDFCGKTTLKKPCDLKRYSKHYCDRECHISHASSLRRTVCCSACGKEINSFRKISATGLYFCNKKCQNPYIAAHYCFKDNPNTSRTRRPTALRRHNNACQQCGYNEDTRMLDVHRNGDRQDNHW